MNTNGWLSCPTVTNSSSMANAAAANTWHIRACLQCALQNTPLAPVPPTKQSETDVTQRRNLSMPQPAAPANLDAEINFKLTEFASALARKEIVQSAA